MSESVVQVKGEDGLEGLWWRDGETDMLGVILADLIVASTGQYRKTVTKADLMEVVVPDLYVG